MKTIRVKLTEETQETLEEIRTQLNCNWQVAANIAILNGRNAVGGGKSGTTKGINASENDKSGAEMPVAEASSLYIYNTNNNNNKGYSKGKLLPEDFNPPHSITDDAGLERQGAIIQFTKWAKAGKKRYPCWNEAFRFACNNWLPKANEHLLINNKYVPKIKEIILPGED